MANVIMFYVSQQNASTASNERIVPKIKTNRLNEYLTSMRRIIDLIKSAMALLITGND